MYFAGYTFDDEGIRVWPLKSLKWTWDDLQSIQVRVSEERNGPQYQTAFSFFGTEKEFSVTSSASKSYFAALKLAVDRASDDVFIADKAHFLLRWSATIPLLAGLRKEFARTQDGKVGVALAHVYWARLNFCRAYRVFNKVLLKDSHNLEALSGRVAIDIERGKSAEKIIHQLENVLKIYPDDRMALRNIAMYLLDADDDRGVDFAERCMTLYPDEIDVPQFLSAYYFRRQQYDQAATALDSLTADMQKRSVRMLASERLTFIRRYATSAEFRAETDRKVRTKQVVGWAWLALSLTPLVLYAGFLVWVSAGSGLTFILFASRNHRRISALPCAVLLAHDHVAFEAD